MEHLLLVNPRRTHRRRRRRNARGRRRMPAALARYWATHRRGKKRTRLANPRRRKRRGVFAMSRRRRRSNPRRHHHRARVHRSHRRNPRRSRFHRRRLRNPRAMSRGGGLSLRNVVHQAIVPAGIGAAGAVAINVAMGYVNPYLPASLQGGYVGVLVQGAGAVGLGILSKRFLGAERARMVVIGALTVAAYSLLNQLLSGVNAAGIPGVTGTVSDYTPYPMHGMRGLGYVSPAAVVGPTMSPRMGAYMVGPTGTPGIRGLGAYMTGAPNVMGDYGDGM